MHSAESLALMEDEHLATGPSRIGYWRLGCLMGLGNGSRQDGKAMQCFMLIWFNGQWLTREGLWICGLAKFPPYSYVIILRMHHYTVHESCFDAICIVRIRLLGIAIVHYCLFGLTLPALMIMGWIMERHDSARGVQKTALSAPLRSLATNRMQLCNLTHL